MQNYFEGEAGLLATLGYKISKWKRDQTYPIKDSTGLAYVISRVLSFPFWGFFIGGAGLMIIQPVLPMYFSDTLSLSYFRCFNSHCSAKRDWVCSFLSDVG
jgi:hypothetical protein